MVPREIIQRFWDHLSKQGFKPAFVGSGEKDGRDCLVIDLQEKNPAEESKIPKEFEGYPVVMLGRGHIRVHGGIRRIPRPN